MLEVFQSPLLDGLGVHPLKQGPLGLSPVGARKRLGLHHVLFELKPPSLGHLPWEEQWRADAITFQLKHTAHSRNAAPLWLKNTTRLLVQTW